MAADAQKWPDSDPEVMALLAAADDRSLHAMMCDVAEHAIERVEAVYQAAGYRLLPDREAIDVKRAWLAGEADEAELEAAQRGAVWSCYWGNPIAIGAAALGATWYPGSGLALPLDEMYAEAMTWFERADEATAAVMHEAVKGVGECHYRAEWFHGDREASTQAYLEAEAREQEWQRERARLLTPR
ncbi:MAG: hypothetical protein R3B09_01815 [Nannocystaceae bacterium]